MENLKKLYIRYNDLLDQLDKSYDDIGKEVDELVLNIIGNPDSYLKPISKELIEKAKQMFKLYVDFDNSVDADRTIFINRQFAVWRGLDLLFLWDDNKPIDLLRSAEPFCCLSNKSKRELKGIIELSHKIDMAIEDLEGNELFEIAKTYNLPQRTSRSDLSRKLKGLAA